VKLDPPIAVGNGNRDAQVDRLGQKLLGCDDFAVDDHLDALW